MSESVMTDVARDEDDEHRDVYAYFGLAYYLSECVHRGLVNMFAYGSGPQISTRPWLEERFTRAEAMTLGDVAQAATPFLPDEVRESVRVLVTGRNYLAHGFWYERIHETQSTAGRQALIQFLKDTAESFRLVSHQLDDCMDRRMKELGVPPDSLDEAFQQTLREAPPKSVKRRLLRVEERVRLTDAWLVPSAESRGKALVLRDADGSFWQLGETGLGWSFRDSPADNWRVYKGLQTMLPAEIVARPRGTKPWNYQLHISTGGLLCVTRSPDGLLDVSVKRIP